MMDLLAWIEASSLSAWVRESPSLWAYPTVLFVHTAGLAILVGTNAIVSLRLLGIGSRMPVAPLVRYFPIMWFGFWLNAATGTLLLMTEATYTPFSTLFQVKMLFVGVAVASMWLIRNRVFTDPALTDRSIPVFGKVLAATALVFWAGATVAGRLLAYIA